MWVKFSASHGYGIGPAKFASLDGQAGSKVSREDCQVQTFNLLPLAEVGRKSRNCNAERPSAHFSSETKISLTSLLSSKTA